MEVGAGYRGRRVVSRLLAIAGAVFLLVGSLFLYAAHAIFDSEEFAKRPTRALEDERVREPIAEAIVDGLIENAEPDLVNARPLLVSVTSGILGTAAFERVFREAAARAHRTFFTRGGDKLVLNLADGASLAVDALRSVSPEIAAELPDDTSTKLNRLVENDLALEVATAAEDVRLLGVALPLTAVVLFAVAAAVHPRRRGGVLLVALAVAFTAAVGLAGLLALRAIVINGLGEDLQDAGAGVWDAFLGDLATWYAIALGAALLLAAVITTGRRVDAVEPLRRLALLAGRPSSTLGQIARAFAVLVAGILIVSTPAAFLQVFAVAVGAYALFFALSELLALVLPPPAPGDPETLPLRDRIRPRRVLVALGVIAAIVIAVVALGGGGEERGSRVRPAASIERCNGFAELCDRRVNEVVLPAVHNAMSAAEDGYLIANNRKGISDQLAAGVRALLIDAHWGRRRGGEGVVVTDLKAEGGRGKAREQAVAATSEEFVVTAERLIERSALGEVRGGEPGVYFCHVFCELGATPAVELFDDVRAFLASHPDEVVLLVIEDYVPPEEIEAAVTESGLIDYVYTYRRDEPLPTLRRMIASGKRALVVAENEGGGESVPWYGQAFELAQETPYTFHDPGELAAKASCAENRGDADNPLFQLNHWVEAVPRSPKTAARVNSYEFLRDRALRCARVRGLTPTWIAVDFWEQGDLFEVARRLNGVGRATEPTYAGND